MDKIGAKSRPTSCIVSISSQQNCIPNKKGKQKPVCEMRFGKCTTTTPIFYYSNFKHRLHSVHNLKQNKTKNEKNKKVKNKIKQMLFFESLSPSVGRNAGAWPKAGGAEFGRQHPTAAGVSYQWRAYYRSTSTRD
jgi:hypothetical protein